MIRDLIVGCIGAFGGTLGFCYLLNAPRRTVLPASVTGLIGQLAYMLLYLHNGQSLMMSYLAASVLVTVICEILARRMRIPATCFLLSALVPLVPGYQFFAMMLGLVQDDGHAAAAKGLEAVQVVAAIAVGAAVTSVLFRTASIWSYRRRMKREAMK